MRLSARALAIVSGLIWGGGLLVVGLIHLAAPSYGVDFLREISSLYPGFHVSRSLASVVVGALYGVIDGAIGGLVFAWLYNYFVARASHA